MELDKHALDTGWATRLDLSVYVHCMQTVHGDREKDSYWRMELILSSRVWVDGKASGV